MKSLSDAITAGTNPPPDPDPVLNALETTGKAVFIRACGQCHGNTAGHPSGSTPIAQGTVGTPTELVRYHDISSACPRPVDTATPRREKKERSLSSAREMRIPCVVGTMSGTSLIKDGQTITVDGSRGIVRIED